MKRLSPRAHELFALLIKSPAAERLPLLQQIGTLDELATIPALAPYLFDDDLALASAVAGILDRLLRRARLEQLPALDELVRNRLHSSRVASGIQPFQVAGFTQRIAEGAVALRVLSCHPAGRVREEAVRRLGLVPGATELPFLLLRLSDWTLQVAHVARDAVRPKITAALLPQWIRVYALVLRLQTLRRGPRDLARHIETLVRTQASPEEMLKGLDSSHPATRRCFWHYLVAMPGVSSDQRLETARRHPDVAIRREALGEAESALPAAQAQALLRAFLLDRHPGLRREALRILSERFPDQAGDALQAALFDHGTSVRSSARFHLSRLTGAQDFAAAYREVVIQGEPERLAAAMGGLAETGGAPDADLLLPYWVSPRPLIRKRVLRGIAALAPGEHRELFMQGLQDHSPGVSKQARQVLLGSAGGLDGMILWTLISSAPHRHVRLGSLNLLGQVEPWESLPFLLKACAVPDIQLAHMAEALLRKRMRSRFWGTASRQQWQRLSEEIDRTAALLPGWLVEQLRFTLRTTAPL